MVIGGIVEWMIILYSGAVFKDLTISGKIRCVRIHPLFIPIVHAL